SASPTVPTRRDRPSATTTISAVSRSETRKLPSRSGISPHGDLRPVTTSSAVGSPSPVAAGVGEADSGAFGEDALGGPGAVGVDAAVAGESGGAEDAAGSGGPAEQPAAAPAAAARPSRRRRGRIMGPVFPARTRSTRDAARAPQAFAGVRHRRVGLAA